MFQSDKVSDANMTSLAIPLGRGNFSKLQPFGMEIPTPTRVMVLWSV